MESAYDLFRNGSRLLADGNYHAAAIPLLRARELEPSSASVREALGRALFGAQRYAEAAAEFEAVAEKTPTNDYTFLQGCWRTDTFKHGPQIRPGYAQYCFDARGNGSMEFHFDNGVVCRAPACGLATSRYWQKPRPAPRPQPNLPLSFALEKVSALFAFLSRLALLRGREEVC